MKNFITIGILYLLITIQIHSQTINGQFVTNINGNKLEVSVETSMQSGTGSAGVVSIDFTYNTAALSFSASPVSGTDYILQGGFAGYNTKNITRPSANTIRISLVTTGVPVSLSTSPVNIITFYFTITNPSGTSDLIWTTTNVAPVLLQPNYTVGTWSNLSASLQLPAVSGQFVTNINGSKYEITIAVNMLSGTGSAGVASIEFSFNTAGLSFPMSPVSGTDYVLQGGFSGYNTKNITRPAANKIRISLVTTGTPVPLSTSPTNIITLYLPILNNSATADLVWTMHDIAPVFLQPNYTAVSWNNLANPLPVELTSFKAEISGNNVELRWSTATETNNYGFEIQRSFPALDKEGEGGGWITLGFVLGNGNSYSPKEYSFIDDKPSTGVLQYRIKQIDNDGKFAYYSSVAEVQYNLTDVKEKQLPKEFNLFQNYPNPFNPSTVIRYSLPQDVHVTLKVYSILGKEVATLVNENKQPGNYNVMLNSNNLAAGAYIYELKAGNYTSVKKFMVLK